MIRSLPTWATIWLGRRSGPVPEPDQKTNPRMKTAITANSVHFRWWKLLRIVLSIEKPLRPTKFENGRL